MIQRITDPEKVIHLVPWLVPVDQTVLEIGAEIYRRTVETPDEILILVDLDEKGYCHGLLVATLEEDCIFGWQARCDRYCKVQKEAAKVVMTWAKENNRSTIRLKYHKLSLNRYYKRYGFLSN